jgi:hypothetical protein
LNVNAGVANAGSAARRAAAVRQRSRVAYFCHPIVASDGARRRGTTAFELRFRHLDLNVNAGIASARLDWS